MYCRLHLKQLVRVLLNVDHRERRTFVGNMFFIIMLNLNNGEKGYTLHKLDLEFWCFYTRTGQFNI